MNEGSFRTPSAASEPLSETIAGVGELPSIGSLERPVPGTADNRRFGSDVVAETLRAIDVPYIALNPGASFRGLHDSLVNRGQNTAPQMLLCLHEEHAVAIAHGWAKVTGTAMAAAVHSNVGLMHATMAIFNAWCDRMPVVVIGATGPLDAAKRRPWIDWIHTAQDQASIVRQYVKFDAQPTSAAAAQEALLRAAWLAGTAPKGPVYVVLDSGMQEEALAEPVPALDATRFRPAVQNSPSGSALDRAADLLRHASKPLILMGRGSREVAAWERRVALAEILAARVATEIKIGAVFPTDHPLHVGHPTPLPAKDLIDAVREADVILSLDWVDLAGTLSVSVKGAPAAAIIQVTVDHHLHNGWTMDHQALPPVDLFLPADPDLVVEELLSRLGGPLVPHVLPPVSVAPAVGPDQRWDTRALAQTLRRKVADRPASLLHVSLGWNGADWPFRHPLDYLGSEGGGGIGGGPGVAVGSALALRGSGRLPIAVLGDGDYLMGVTAIWTAVHYRIPMLIVVANNVTFYNDEVHQERVAMHRGRPPENKWIGQRIQDPFVDIAGMARAQGAHGWGPVSDAASFEQALSEAIATVDAGGVAVVDVRIAAG